VCAAILSLAPARSRRAAPDRPTGGARAGAGPTDPQHHKCGPLRPLISSPLDEDAWQQIARSVARASIDIDVSSIRWRFADGEVVTATTGAYVRGDPLPPRLHSPGTVFSRLSDAPGEIALVSAVSDARYALSWHPFVRALGLSARSAGARLYFWLGPLPPELSVIPPACLAIKESCLFKGRHTSSGRHLISNHFAKVAATLMALDEVGVAGAIWIDVDAAFPRALQGSELAAAFTPGVSLSLPMHFEGGSVRKVPWLVCGCAFTVRADDAGRRLLRLWLANRCGFKDQPSLWDTIRQGWLEAGCLDRQGSDEPLLSSYNEPYTTARYGVGLIGNRAGGFRDRPIDGCASPLLVAGSSVRGGEVPTAAGLAARPPRSELLCNMHDVRGPEQGWYCMIAHLQESLKGSAGGKHALGSERELAPEREQWLRTQETLLANMARRQANYTPTPSPARSIIRR
jgi:hypothetical protein